jgi:hypothetical protein
VVVSVEGEEGRNDNGCCKTIPSHISRCMGNEIATNGFRVVLTTVVMVFLMPGSRI